MRAGIAFGSNVGDRLSYLRKARREVLALSEVHEPVLASPVYETEPIGSEPDAGPFLNAVLEIELTANPTSLLAKLGAIEGQLGRASKRPRNASRTIDLDLLYAGEVVLDEAELSIPHPRLHLRRFVLQPMADLRPDLVLPGHEKSIAMLLAELNDRARVELFAENWRP